MAKMMAEPAQKKELALFFSASRILNDNHDKRFRDLAASRRVAQVRLVPRNR
jgi:hypothetical protein